MSDEMSDEMREAFDFFYDKHFWKKSIKRNLVDKITGQPYFYPEKDDAWIKTKGVKYAESGCKPH